MNLKQEDRCNEVMQEKLSRNLRELNLELNMDQAMENADEHEED